MSESLRFISMSSNYIQHDDDTFEKIRFILAGCPVERYLYTEGYLGEDAIRFMAENPNYLQQLNKYCLKCDLLDCFINNPTMTIDDIKIMQNIRSWDSLVPESPRCYFVGMLQERIFDEEYLFKQFTKCLFRKNLLLKVDTEEIERTYYCHSKIAALNLIGHWLPRRRTKWFDALLEVLSDWKMPDFEKNLRRMMMNTGMYTDDEYRVPVEGNAVG